MVFLTLFFTTISSSESSVVVTNSLDLYFGGLDGVFFDSRSTTTGDLDRDPTRMTTTTGDFFPGRGDLDRDLGTGDFFFLAFGTTGDLDRDLGRGTGDLDRDRCLGDLERDRDLCFCADITKSTKSFFLICDCVLSLNFLKP